MNGEELENIKINVRNSILTMIPGDRLPTEEEFNDAANRARQALPIFFPKITISDEDWKKIIDDIRTIFQVKMSGTKAYITGKDAHKPWLDGIKSKIDWFFWSRYYQYLSIDKGMPRKVVASLDTTSNYILDLLGNPKAEVSFNRRGLVIGEVQSGKTANYTAICNKAADVGYKVIIVLTGMLEDLRKQTQERLDLEFAGANSQIFLTQNGIKRYQKLGVAKRVPNNKDHRIPQFTSTIKDFSNIALQQLNLTIPDINGTILFVVKKNKTILNNLIEWLEKSNLIGNQTQLDYSLLLIDDEADNASINTNDKEADPTAINRCIREILGKFKQTTYLGITATPFANIFIHPESEKEMFGDDLFPKDFIYALDVPDSYIGAEAIFGDKGKYGNMLVEIEPRENPDVEKFFPKGHKSDLQVDDLPASLYEAMNYFLLTNVVRDLRGDAKAHRTMLVHVSLLTDIQNKVYNIVNPWLADVKIDLRNYSKLPAEEAERESEHIAALHKVFVNKKFDFEKLCGMSWEEVLHDRLRDAIEPVVAGLRNAVTKSPPKAFNYEGHSEGLRVIAIGGNSFSRGLTLEGLCVTYFYRRSKTYDTLMQMGRWFGYRPNYDDLCKIWTTREIMDWYGYITGVSQELRQEISIMQKYNMTPKQFGLKVRQHPGALMITARNKMRDAQLVTRPVALDKVFLETPRLLIDKNDENKKIIAEFVNSLKEFPAIEGYKKSHSWSGVPKKEIADLIGKFQTAPWHLEFQSKPIGDYISGKTDDTPWDVVIAEGNGEVFSELKVGGKPITVKPIERKILVEDGMIKVSGTKLRVGSLGMTKIGLTEDEKRRAEKEYRSIAGNENTTNLPDRAYMIYGRKPLLVVYVIRPKKPENGKNLSGIPDILFALGVGFPASSPLGEYNVDTADYYANFVATVNFDLDDFCDDEEVEE